MFQEGFCQKILIDHGETMDPVIKNKLRMQSYLIRQSYILSSEDILSVVEQFFEAYEYDVVDWDNWSDIQQFLQASCEQARPSSFARSNTVPATLAPPGRSAAQPANKFEGNIKGVPWKYMKAKNICCGFNTGSCKRTCGHLIGESKFSHEGCGHPRMGPSDDEDSQAKAFKTFAEAAWITSLPLSGEEVCFYAIWLWIVRGLKAPKSIQMYLSVVRTLHRKVGLDCVTPTPYGPLGNVMSGLKRKLQHKVKKASPITPTTLINLVKTFSLTPLCPITQQTLVVLRILALLCVGSAIGDPFLFLWGWKRWKLFVSGVDISQICTLYF